MIPKWWHLLLIAYVASFIQVTTGNYIVAGIVGIILILLFDGGWRGFKTPPFLKLRTPLGYNTIYH
jgi:hypothetical protein